MASLIPASRTRKPWHQDMQQLLYTPVRPTEITHQGIGCCWPGSPTFGFFSDSKGPPPFRSAPRARAFLAARPHGQLCLEPHRLGIHDAGDDAWFPQCKGILDRFSLHAGTWSAGGERTLRHHALRDTSPTSGLRGQVGNQNGTSLVCSFPQKKPALGGATPPMSLFLASLPFQPRSM